MNARHPDSFHARTTLAVDGQSFHYYSLPELAQAAGFDISGIIGGKTA